MKLSLAQLICSFEDEQGLPELAYAATCRLIREEISDLASSLFSKSVDAIDGRFYLKPNTKNILLEEMEQLR